MASDPNALPESIVLAQFAGIKNTVSEERLAQGELSAAVNVDIDDSGQLRRRRGRTKVADGNFHSLFKHRGQAYVVRNEVLGELTPSYGFVSKGAQVGPHRLATVSVGDTCYFASDRASGKFVGQGPVETWGQLVSEGIWHSPVLDPTETLGEIGGSLLGAVPTAEHLTHYNGRIYLGRKRLLWATELYLYDLVDKTRNFMQFEHDITMLQAVDNGIYVGTEGGLYFLAGTLVEGLKLSQISEAAVIPGSDVRVPHEKLHPSGKRGEVRASTAVACLTTEGAFGCFDGGEAYNLTLGTVVFPRARSAAALFRDQSGVNSYIVAADSAGSPSANARIGDFVDAEIVRFQGG